MRIDQYYAFMGPDGWAWCEMWDDRRRAIVPTPFRTVQSAIDHLSDLHPEAYVDGLCMASELAEVARDVAAIQRGELDAFDLPTAGRGY